MNGRTCSSSGCGQAAPLKSGVRQKEKEEMTKIAVDENAFIYPMPMVLVGTRKKSARTDGIMLTFES